MGSSWSKKPAPALELAGKWRACKKELWEFTPTNYGPRCKNFEKEGYKQFKLECSTTDATFTFEYGTLASGTGQWFKCVIGKRVRSDQR